MKMIIAIIQDDFVNKVIRSLMEHRIRTTRLSSSGGFLKAGNTTLLMGVEEEQVEEIVNIIRAQCETTKIREEGKEITLKGANLFILDVEESLKV